MRRCVLGIDLGTSAAKALLLTDEGQILAKGAASYPTHSTSDGRIEQAPDDWWHAVTQATRTCLSNAPHPTNVVGLGFSGHMSVLLPLDRNHQPLRAAMTIADTRGEDETRWLNAQFGAELSTATGNTALTAFTLPKLLWFRRHEPEAFNATRAIVSAKDYLRFRATDALAAEPTDGGNTLLLDHRARRWNTSLLEQLGLPATILPPLKESLEVAGELTSTAAAELGLKAGTPVITGLADMAASVLGAGLLTPARVAITIGTSGQITQVVDAPKAELLGRFTYHPHALPGKHYVMASLFTGGLGLQWFSHAVASIMNVSPEEVLPRIVESATHSPPGARGVTFLPFLTGSGSPDFDPAQRSAFLGLGRGHNGGDLSRAILEGIGFSIRHCLEELTHYHPEPAEWVAGGGGMRDPLWRGIISDIIRMPLARLREEDAGPLGTALAVGMSLGLYADLPEQVERTVQLETPQEPSPTNHVLYDRAYRRYQEHYKSALRNSRATDNTG